MIGRTAIHPTISPIRKHTLVPGHDGGVGLRDFDAEVPHCCVCVRVDLLVLRLITPSVSVGGPGHFFPTAQYTHRAMLIY